MLDAGTISKTDENKKSIISAGSMSRTKFCSKGTLIFQETRVNLLDCVRHYDLLDAYAHLTFNLRNPLRRISPPPISLALCIRFLTFLPHSSMKSRLLRPPQVRLVNQGQNCSLPSYINLCSKAGLPKPRPDRPSNHVKRHHYLIHVVIGWVIKCRRVIPIMPQIRGR